MKTVAKLLIGLSLIVTVTLIIFQSDRSPAANPGRGLAGTTATNSSSQEDEGVFVSDPVTPKLSPALRDMPTMQFDPSLNTEVINPRSNPLLISGDPFDVENIQDVVDPLVERSRNSAATTPPISTSFEGISATGALPPDTIGEVGPNHYVQMVNTAIEIFDKSGSSLMGPVNINNLWNGAGGFCESNNDGDPIVLYDSLADRWLVTQFFGSSSDGICAAVSTTSDPTGSYFLYEFITPNFPDYFKFGVWPDAYYMSANESSYTAYAFDRDQMLTGASATFQRFAGHSNLLMPSDLDGSTIPPANSPNYFYTFKDNSFHGGSDRLEIFAFDVDWAAPGNSSFTLVDTIPITAFTYTVCGFFVFDCIPQPSTTEGLDPVGEWPMWRLQYRNFGTHETLVGNFTVDVGGDTGGIRWFELRKTGSNWSLHQEGTHSPDSHSRWMGSIAMDRAGNIALGYSASSSSLFPSIRYTIREAGDTLGTLQTEATMQAGGGSQTSNFNRWGDYSSLNVDPSDDCTFWYTNEYYNSTSTGNWRTRIGSFTIPSCLSTGTADLSIEKSDSADPLLAGNSLTYSLTAKNYGPDSATGVTVTDMLPAGVSYDSNDAGCSESGGLVTCNVGTLARNETAVININVTPSSSGQITNTATVSATETDDHAANNSATETTNITDNSSADVGISGEGLPPLIVFGNTYSYTLNIVNNGGLSASSVMVTNTLSLSITIESVATTDGTCFTFSNEITCDMGTIAAGNSETVVVTVTPTEIGSVMNVAELSAAEFDPIPENNQSIIFDTISPYTLMLPIIMRN